MADIKFGEFKFGECMFHAQVLCMTSSRRVRYSECVSQGVNKSRLDSTASAMETFQIESCVRGHHIYKDIWNPSGEELTCSHEIENTKDPFAVAVKCYRTTIVGHVLQNISCMCCS